MMMRFSVLVLAALLGTPLQAQPMPKDYPSKPIKAVVPSPPGGPPDLLIRMLTPKLGAGLGQPVIVENRAGAGGIVGTAFVAKTAPDGYTWLFTTASHTNTPPFNENVPFDPVRDFSHVSLVAQNFGQALIVPPGSPAKSVQELIALARRQPGKLNYGSAGIGTASHIPAELMKSMTGTDIVGVQYRGVAEAITDLLAGRIDLFFVGTQLAAQHAHTGKVRVLALTGAKRWKGLPDVPTMQEAGFKDYNLINWFGLWLPAGASPELMARLHAETVKALADPEVRQQFDAQGLEAVGMPPAEFAKFVAAESAFINELARKINAAPKK
jgi:tripartite-type tricarboxylate transporter receptor subunit TctC